MNLLNPTFTIDIQPKQNFHFRYVSELRSTHGVINGQQEGTDPGLEDTYPTIKLRLPTDGHQDECGNNRDFYVLCSLHSYAKDGSQSLSPHLLMSKGRAEVNYDFIFAKMDENPSNPLERTWQLKDYVIVRLKNEQYQASLRGKMAHFQSMKLPMKFDDLKGNLHIDDGADVRKKGVLNVCLGFTIFERDFYENTYRLYKETIYSKNIFHGDELRIHRLCNTKGSILGGTNVNVLIKLQSGYDYNVHMFRRNSNNTTTDWQKTIAVTSQDIFSNAAITFKLPAGPIVAGNADEVEVRLEIVVGNSNYKSPCVPFFYLNNTEEAVRRKIPRRQEEDYSMVAINPHDMHYSDYSSGTSPSQLDSHRQSDSSSQSSQSNSPNQSSTPSLLDSLIHFRQVSDLPNFPNQSSTPSLFDSSSNSPDVSDLPNFPNQSSTPSLFDSLSNLPDFSDLETLDPIEFEIPLQEPIYFTADKAVVHPEPLAENVLRYKIKRIDVPKIVEERISDILKEGKDLPITGISKAYGNTIFHDALMNYSLFYNFFGLVRNSERMHLVLKARNRFRHNLLHYACYRNKPDCIRPLVVMGCGLHEQEWKGRTPLHLAIDRKNTKCIMEIQKLLQTQSKVDQKVIDNLIRMFGVYDHSGYTILHAAVLADMQDLLRVMLEFCQKYNIDITEYEVLGNGDSIVHLIGKSNQCGMMDMIKEYVPDYLTIENYPGETVLDLPGLSKEMLQAINI